MKLSELRKLGEKATEGPWWWDGDVCDYDKEQEAPWLISGHGPQVPVLKGEIEGINPADADFIATARTYLPLLVEVAAWAGDYIHDIDNGLVSGCHERRAHLIYEIRAALKRLETTP